MTNKIKKCPFCGDEAHIIKIYKEFSDNSRSLIGEYIECSNIFCSAKIELKIQGYDTTASEIEKWNRRVQNDK